MHVALDAIADALLVITAVIAAALWAPAPPQAATRPATGTTAAGLRADIDRLPVSAPADAATYERAQFPHWIEVTPGCDTRCAVLDRQRSVDGWVSAYDGFVTSNAGELEIDHVVPLAEAWVSGASAWSVASRQAFANDLAGTELLAVSSWSNQAKGAADPATWRPPDPAWWCRYAQDWTQVKLRWDLSADRAEVEALSSMAERC